MNVFHDLLVYVQKELRFLPPLDLHNYSSNLLSNMKKMGLLSGDMLAPRAVIQSPNQSQIYKEILKRNRNGQLA